MDPSKEPATATVVSLERVRRARKALQGLPRILSMNETLPEWLVRAWVELNDRGEPCVVALVARASWAVKACFPVNIGVGDGYLIPVVVRAVSGGGADWERPSEQESAQPPSPGGTVLPYGPQNVLPENFLTHDQGDEEDPWPP